MTRRGYAPRWDFTLPYGEAGEQYVYELLSMPAGAHVEVKRKSYTDDRFYVEVEQSPADDGDYRPSGLATTSADYWAFVIAETGVIVIVPTALLRERLSDALG